MKRLQAFAAAIGVAAAAHRRRPDQVGHAHALPADQLPHGQHQPVRRRRRQGHRRQAQDHRCIPGASLFKAPEIKRAVQSGQAQIGEILISGYSNEDPIFGVDSVPFLATSYADARKLWKASRKATEERFAKQGMKVLYAVPWPPQGIYTNKPLTSVADMKGLKMRAYNPATSKIAELVGAQPVTVQAAELAQAMTTGVVNANITSGATGVRHEGLGAREVLLRHAGLASEEHRVREPEGVRRARQGDARTRCSRPRPTPRRAAGRTARRRPRATSRRSRRTA